MYELYYWPGLQGRGEFIRLALEDAGAPYIDVARSPEHGGIKALQRLLAGEGAGALPPLAPPILRSGELLLAQVANILLYLAPRLDLVGADEASRHHAHQLQLTVADLVAEVHDTHHPISTALYYEDQKPEALRRSAAFVAQRLPKFLGYFEKIIAPEGFAIGGRHSYVDLSLFQVVEGLRYAFPQGMARVEPSTPRLIALRDRVAARPRVAAYLASGRRIPFNEHGIFRRYPELDQAPLTGAPCGPRRGEPRPAPRGPAPRPTRPAAPG